MPKSETKPLDLRAAPLDMFLSERQLADATGESAAFFRKMRYRGSGPLFKVFSERKLRYTVRDVLAWLDGIPSHTNMERNPSNITPQRREMLSKAGQHVGKSKRAKS